MAKLLWQPTAERVRASNMFRFMQFVNERHGCDFKDYPALYRWSVEHIPEFWAAMWDFAGIRHSAPYREVVDDVTKMPGARWFSGAKLNFAENLLRHRDAQTALVFQGEGRPPVRLSYAELYDAVARLARSLRDMGIRPGDRVVGFLPNMPQATIAMLAATSLGAVWSSCSPDFGIKGVLDRFGQIQPRVLFTADGYFFKGRRIDSLERMAGILKELRSIERVVVVPYTEEAPDAGRLPNAVPWAEFLALGEGQEAGHVELEANEPLFILATLAGPHLSALRSSHDHTKKATPIGSGWPFDLLVFKKGERNRP